MEQIKIQIKAKHFKDADYSDNCGCPLALAAMEQFGTDRVSEGVVDIRIDGTHFQHDKYAPIDYTDDYNRAEKLGFADETIRIITLYQYQ